MSASRSFIDVLVGKLTAYVDASSRPAPTIYTPDWAATLSPLPTAAAGFACRAYTSQARQETPTTPPVAMPWYEAIARARAEQDRAVAAPSSAGTPAHSTPRSAVERTAIQLLQRLGASEISDASTTAEVRSAYRRLLRSCHPDAHPDASEAERAALTTRLRAVIRAWSVFEHATTTDVEAA